MEGKQESKQKQGMGGHGGVKQWHGARFPFSGVCPTAGGNLNDEKEEALRRLERMRAGRNGIPGFGTIMARNSGRNEPRVFQEMKGDQMWNILTSKGADL